MSTGSSDYSLGSLIGATQGIVGLTDLTYYWGLERWRPKGVLGPARTGPKRPSCGRLTGRTPLHYPADLRTYTMGSCVPQAKYSFAVVLPYDGWGSWGPVVRARKLWPKLRPRTGSGQHPCGAHMRHNEQRKLDGAGLLGVGISSPTILAHLVTSSVGLECFLVHH